MIRAALSLAGKLALFAFYMAGVGGMTLGAYLICNPTA